MTKVKSETEQEISRFIKILIGVVIVILGVYLFTNTFVSKEYDIKSDGKSGSIDPSIILVGSILNRPESEYYVLAYKKDEVNAALFETYINKYEQKDDAKSIYKVDLSNELNKKYYSKESTTNVTNISEIKLSSPTLLKIKDKKIVKSINISSDIKSELGL